MDRAFRVRHRRASRTYHSKDIDRDRSESPSHRRRRRRDLQCVAGTLLIATGCTYVLYSYLESLGGLLFFFPSERPLMSTQRQFTIYAQSGRYLNKRIISERIDYEKPYLHFPVDTDDDPFLPWIHDYFRTDDSVRFIAQNKRRCETGKGKQDIMKYWEPQMALFQPVAVTTSNSRYSLTAPEEATYPETRFICRFHSAGGTSATAFSEYSFNYEYLNWRKRVDKPMFEKEGPDVKIFDYSTLLFSCQVPKNLRTKEHLWVDLVPIRTAVRYNEGYLLTKEQVGGKEFEKLHRFNTTKHYGKKTTILPLDQSGRFENLPLGPAVSKSLRRKHKLVACTWAAATYDRRGGQGVVEDTPARLLEWIVFHRLAGYDQIYLYDNTQGEDLPLKKVANLFFDFVTYIRWPGK